MLLRAYSTIIKNSINVSHPVTRFEHVTIWAEFSLLRSKTNKMPTSLLGSDVGLF